MLARRGIVQASRAAAAIFSQPVRYKSGTMRIIRLVPADNSDPNLRLGPYPRTKEERELAAKKYNLIPEDYEPYDEGEGLGDYPRLKPIGVFNKDPYCDYDDEWYRHYHGEVVHRDADLYYYERIDPLMDEKGHPSWLYRAAVFFGVALFLPTVGTISEHFNIQINHPWKIRINKNQVLYEFPSV